MNIRMGATFFADVDIPILWGSRALLRDREGHVSVINLDTDTSVLEVIDDKPAHDMNVSRTADDFTILNPDGADLYTYNPTTKTLTSTTLRLPPVTIGRQQLRVGSNVFAGNIVAGLGVGIVVSEHGIALGASLPPTLAALPVQA